jgi:hypothetical protein
LSIWQRTCWGRVVIAVLMEIPLGWLECSAACPDHPCDNCAYCRSSGKCCKRDIPGYQLPVEGSWPAPIYGEFGVLSYDSGGAALCHICGAAYEHLGNHIARTHELTPWEYKAYFGLNMSTGLIGRNLQKKRHDQNLDRDLSLAQEISSAVLTPERRQAYSKARRYSAEARRGNEVKERKGQCELCGATFKVILGSRERFCSGRCSHLWMRDHSPIKGQERTPRVQRICAFCGKIFSAPPWKEKRFCTKRCSSRATLPSRTTPEVRAKVAVAAGKREIIRNPDGTIKTWVRLAMCYPTD